MACAELLIQPLLPECLWHHWGGPGTTVLHCWPEALNFQACIVMPMPLEVAPEHLNIAGQIQKHIMRRKGGLYPYLLVLIDLVALLSNDSSNLTPLSWCLDFYKERKVWGRCFSGKQM